MVKCSETQLFRLGISDTNAVFVCDCDPYTTLHCTKFFLPANHLNITKKDSTLAGIFTSKTCYPLAWQMLFLLLCSWGMQPWLLICSFIFLYSSWIQCNYPVVNSHCSGPVLAAALDWTGLDSLVGGTTGVTHWAESGEIILSIQPGSTQR